MGRGPTFRNLNHRKPTICTVFGKWDGYVADLFDVHNLVHLKRGVRGARILVRLKRGFRGAHNLVHLKPGFRHARVTLD